VKEETTRDKGALRSQTIPKKGVKKVLIAARAQARKGKEEHTQFRYLEVWEPQGLTGIKTSSQTAVLGEAGGSGGASLPQEDKIGKGP